ncbi:MAG: hypothetical protein Q9218_000769 [Villophora microphyllina]
MMFWYTNGVGKWLPARLPPTTPLRLASTLPVLQDATFFCSLGWILYRIWQIYQKPVDELVDLLGLDIPPFPDVSLAGITTDSVLLYWKPAENQSTSLKNAIQVNGIKAVGEFGLKDTSIQVIGLRPGHFYNIRVIATNASNFSTLGPLIRLRTLPAAERIGADSTKPVADDVEELSDECEPATIRAGPSQFGPAAGTLNLQAAKEVSVSNTGSRRVVSGRRASPAISVVDPPSLLSSRATSIDEDDSDEAIQRLTEELNRLRHDQHEVDHQLEDEDREHQVLVAELSRDRDHLKQVLKDKEESTADLRKHGGYLEKMNRSAQGRKTAKEKVLHLKKTDRQKVYEEMDRWAKDIESMRQELGRVASEQEKITTAKNAHIARIRDIIAKDHTLIKGLEDEIRMKGSQIKSMERDREHLDGNDENGGNYANTGSNTEPIIDSRIPPTQAQLMVAYQALQQAEAENQFAQERVNYLVSRRSRDPSHFITASALETSLGNRPAKPWRQRQTGSMTNANSLQFNSHQGGLTGVPYNPSHTSPYHTSPTPFFNMSNGMAVPETAAPPAPENLGQSFSDSDILAGGGPMSPTANDLLPSNLFRDEDTMLQESPITTRGGAPGKGPAEWTEIPNSFPADTFDSERLSPGSAGSRRGSLFSSPRGSIQNVQEGHPLGETFADNDQQSIHSSSASVIPNAVSSATTLNTSRLAQLFPAFNRQRGKTSAQEPPALGTLRQGQSQSFPRNMEQDSIDSALETRRRRGSHGNWGMPIAGFLNRSITMPDEDLKGAPTASTRNARAPRNRLNMFGTRVDTDGSSTYPERSSSRPSSVYSFDQLSGRPSNDSQRLGGWPVAENTPSRSSPLGVNWSGGPWLRAPSRRPSVQHGSTSNLSIGSTPLDSEAFDNVLAPPRSEQMPIGTRPRSSQRSSTPKLNPAAPTFKMLFGRSEQRKAAKAEKANERAAEKAAEKERVKEADKANIDEVASLGEESSTSLSRLSRDAGSITTAESAADSQDSLEHSTSGTASEAAASSGPRESLMQKITRKSSSSKFNVPWGKERGGLFSKKAGEPSTPDEVEEDVSSDGHHAKGRESTVSTPHQDRSSRTSLAWPNIRRKSRKGGLVAEKGVDTVDDDNDDD